MICPRRACLRGVAGLLLWIGLLNASAAQDLSGIWKASGYAHEYGRLDFLVEIKRDGPGFWRARKLNPSRYVPTGETHFRARQDGDVLHAEVQVALPGFKEAEMRRHSFVLHKDDAGKVTRIELTDGRTHVLGEADNQSTTDAWSYTPWPSDQFILLLPEITDYGFRAERSSARQDLREAEDKAERWGRDLEAKIGRLRRARAAEAAARMEVERLTAAYAAATARVREIRNAEALGPEQPDELPRRLRVLYQNRDAAKADQERAEARVLAHADGAAPLSPATLATQIRTMDRSAELVTRLSGVIARVREEMGLPPEADPEVARREQLATAGVAEDAARDAMFAARRTLLRAGTELVLANGQVELANEQITEAGHEADAARARIAGLNRPAQLRRIEAAVETVEGGERLVLQAVPSGLDIELAEFRKILDEVDRLLAQAQATSDGTMQEFINKFNEATRLREEMIDLIYVNAAEMALAAGVVKLAEIGIAFGTGGPVGLAVELVTTPIFQFALYDDGVIFSNYDELGLQNAYRRALSEAAPEQDPEAACRDLGIKLQDNFKLLLDQSRRAAVAGYLARRQSMKTGTPDLTGTGPMGTITQRLNPNYLNYTMITLGNVSAEVTGEALDRVVATEAVETAEEALTERVTRRLGAVAAQQLAQFDSAMSNSANSARYVRDAAQRRNAVLRRLAGANPEIADDVARHITEMDELTRRFTNYLRLMRETGDAAELRTVAMAAEIVRAEIKTLQDEMAGRVANIAARDAAFEAVIDLTRSLAAQKSFFERLAVDLGRIDRFKSSVVGGLTRNATKFGLRNSVKGSVASVLASLVFAVALDANINRLQEQERQNWMRIFAAEADQSLLFRAWQRASCIRWALLDQRAALRREYTRIYDQYDRETGMKLLTSEPFMAHETLRFRLVYEPQIEVEMATRIGAANCPQSTRASCRLPAGALDGQSGPYLPVGVDLSPPR